MMNREKVRTFWSERARTATCPESQVILENDPQLAELRARTELELLDAELPLNRSDIVADIGAGNGRFTLFFAPRVRKVTAVEYIKDFAAMIKEKIRIQRLKNVEVLDQPAEDFCRENYADIVYISGMLHYLDKEQYSKVTANVARTLKPGGTFFLCEAISVLEDEFFIDKFSEELNAQYSSLYRTAKQHIDAFHEHGMRLEKYSPAFKDGSVLNKRKETRFFYFVFRKPEKD